MIASLIALTIQLSGLTGRETSSLPAQPETIQLAGAMELARLADLAAARLHIAIEYEPSALTATITLRHDEPLNDSGLWDVLNRQLALKGLTTIIASGGSAYSIVPLANAASLARIEDESTPPAVGTRAELPAGFQRWRSVPRARKAEAIAEAIRPMLSKPGGSLELLGTSGHLIISELTPRLHEIQATLALLDDPTEQVRIEHVNLQYLSGAQVVALATQMALKRESAGAPKLRGEVIAGSETQAVLIIAPEANLTSWRELLTAIDRLEPVTTTTYAMRHHPARDVAALIQSTLTSDALLDPRFRATIDPLTESLIITATASQHTQIEAILERLASIPASERRQMRTIPVKHRPAGDVLAIVDALIDAGAVSIEPTTGSPSAGTDDRAGITRNPSGLEPGRASESLNPGHVPGQPTSQSGGSAQRGPAGSPSTELSLTLDPGTSTILAIGPPRLLDQVESLITSLDVRQRQVELQVLLIGLTDTQTQALGAEIRGEVGLGEIDLKLASLFGLSSAVGDAAPGIGSSAGFSGLGLSPGEFSVLIRALETINHGRSLSMPRVIVASSQRATIDAVLQQPFSSLNAGDTVSTTSFGGTQDAGTQVTLAPQVSAADHIILDYTISLSAFVGESPAEGLPPPRQQNRLQSIVTIPDGSTIAVGGIELDTDTRAVSQIPLLSQIPVFGELLKNRSRTEGRQRFYAFIRPTILRADDFSDLRYLSKQSAVEAGIDDEPILSPRVIR